MYASLKGEHWYDMATGEFDAIYPFKGGFKLGRASHWYLLSIIRFRPFRGARALPFNYLMEILKRPLTTWRNKILQWHCSGRCLCLARFKCSFEYTNYYILIEVSAKLSCLYTWCNIIRISAWPRIYLNRYSTPGRRQGWWLSPQTPSARSARGLGNPASHCCSHILSQVS